MYRIIILLVLGLVLNTVCKAQFSVDTDFNNAEELIRESLIGEGVEILSISYDGGNESIAAFSDGKNTGGHPDGIGVDNGLLITTGAAELVASRGVGTGVESDDMRHEVGNAANAANHPNLLKMVNLNSTINDFSIIRIEFIPETDTFRLNYIWASEEYPYYVCSQFNDRFAFIISGPGISGDYENGGKNIAIIPGTNLPVSINSLNDGDVGSQGFFLYCPGRALAGQTAQYYVDNLDFGAEARPAFNGYSTVLEAKSAVVPCETYVIELIVSDITDFRQDSGVFFEKGSFRTNTTDVVVNTPNNDFTIVEGCESALVDININNSFNAPISLEAEIKGNATLGADYNLYLNGDLIVDETDLVIPATQSIVNLQIEALEDGIIEGTEEVVITYRKALFTNPSGICTDIDSINIFIKDNLLAAKPLPDTLYICGSGSQELDGSITTEIASGNTFENSTDIDISPEKEEIVSTISVSGEEQNAISPNAYPVVCINVKHISVKDLDIYLESPNGKILELATAIGNDFEADFTQTCFRATASEIINNGSSPYTGDFLPEGDFADLLGATINGEWQLKIMDTQTGITGVLNSWSIEFVNPYSVDYMWTPDTDISNRTSPIVAVSPSESILYKLRIEDIYNCSIEDSTYIGVTSEYAFSVDTTHINCFGNNTGSIILNSTDESINYTWEDGSEGAERNNLTAGEYKVTLVGDSGCEQDEIFTIREPEELVYASDIKESSCADVNDGAITINPSGGITPYSITWNEVSSTSFTLDGISSGIYTATLRDANGCEIKVNTVVEENAPYVVAEKEADITCFGNNNGSIELTVSGNSSPISYNWTGPDGFISDASTITDLSAGEYNVIIKEEQGCESNKSYTISEPEEIKVNHNKSDIKCNGENSGSIMISSTGGTAPLQYSIDGGNNYESLSEFTGLAAGAYDIVVKDVNGCTSSDDVQVKVTEPEAITITADSLYNIVYGESVSIKAIPSIDTSEITSISWNPSDYLSCNSCLETISTPETTTIYTLTITDDNTCSVDKVITIRVERSPRVEMPNVFSPNGDNTNDEIFLITDDVIVQSIESFNIYDRWGSLMFSVENAEPNSPELRWDGKMGGKYVETGVYVWMAEILLIDNIKKVYKGTITVLK